MNTLQVTFIKIFLFAALFIAAQASADWIQCKRQSGETYYSNTACFPGERSMPLIEYSAVKSGYELFMGPERIGHEPEWTFAQAVEHYQWYKHKNAATQKSVAYYNGKKIRLNKR